MAKLSIPFSIPFYFLFPSHPPPIFITSINYSVKQPKQLEKNTQVQERSKKYTQIKDPTRLLEKKRQKKTEDTCN